MLNPDRKSFCINAMKHTASLPIFVNQTNPITIEILRIDLDTNLNETITINAKEAKRLKKQADKELGKKDTGGPRILHYPVRKTGLYRLQRVIDDSNLEVQSTLSDTLVVSCPSGSVKAAPRNKCRGDLSNFYFQVDATPPLKVRYSKTVNREDQSHVLLTVHPESSDSPLSRQQDSRTLVKASANEVNLSWARSQHIEIPINETLGVSGGWQYSLDEIHDGFGNVINFTRPEDSGLQRSTTAATLEQIFHVHDRPRAVLTECSPQNPLKVAKGDSRHLPVWLNPDEHHASSDITHYIEYSFTPQLEDTSTGETETSVQTKRASMMQMFPGPEIEEPGLYSLLSVSNEFCNGEILEPSSCLLSNPPEPNLSITSEDIPHQCAGNSVGLRLNLDLIGTPPFRVSYSIHRRGGRTVPREEVIEGLRTQLEFKPREAGFYTYEFLGIADSVYGIPRSLKHKQLRLEQDVKPTAWARFEQNEPYQKACIQERVSFDIYLTGEPPWTLEYDLIHDGKRNRHKSENITSSTFMLSTPTLKQGGSVLTLLNKRNRHFQVQDFPKDRGED